MLARVDAWVDLIHKRRALARSQQQLDERTRAFQGVVSWLAGDLMQAGFGEHPQRVARLVAELAERTGCSADRVTALRLAASLLDIGMREMPADALRRDGPLSEDERRLLRQHPQWVGDRLQELQLPWPLAEWVVQHHERIDGSGYPRGLADQEISPEAGLLGLADLVCAMLAERPYRPGLERQQVIAWLGGPGRAQFPAGPLDACLEVLRDEVLLTALALSGQSPEPSG